MSTETATVALHDGNLFEVKAVEVMRSLRSAFLKLIEAVPGNIRRAADLERALGVSTTLAWQFHRIATSPDPVAIGADVPGMAATRQFLKAATAKGVTDTHITNALRAMEAFEELVHQHAGDRATFVTMINSLAGREGETIDLKTRRQAYRINSQIWGVQAKTLVGCGIYHPGRRSGVFDVISVRGAREIRRLRAGAPFRLSSQQVTDGFMHNLESQAIEPGAANASAPSAGPKLVEGFCTEPHPELDNRIEGGIVHTFLKETPLGNAGAQTLYLVDVTRDVEWVMPHKPSYHYKFNAVMKPVEALVLDALIHRDMFGKLSPTVRVFGSLDRLGERDPEQYGEQETLPVPATVHNLGHGLSALPTPHVPRYAEMFESVCQRVGWDPEQFDLYRCVVEYPLLSTMVCTRFDFPEQGNW
jgi:hypothetical protein